MKNKIRLTSLLSWLFSLIAFVSLLVWMNKVGDKLPLYQTLVNIWLADIAFGVISFIVFISTYPQSKLNIASVDRKQRMIGVSFWSWLSSIMFFFLFFVLIGVKGWTFQNKIVGGILIGDVIFGILSCITFFVSVLLAREKAQTKKKRHNKSSFGKLFLYSTIIFLLLLSIGLSLQNRMEMNAKKAVPQATPTFIMQPTSTPVVYYPQTNNVVNVSNKIDCVGPDGKHFQATKKECDDFNTAWGHPPTPDPNEMIQCSIHPNCGGGYKEMTRAMCSQMICCEVDFNNTMKFTSKDQCNKEQAQNESTSWTNFCNDMCSTYNPDMCKNYWQVGTTGMSNCISDQYAQKSTCLTNCYKDH